MTRLVTIVALLVATTAAAGPFKETLSRDDRTAIAQAIQGALPKVDPAAVKQCQATYDPKTIEPQTDPARAADAAACYRKAGSLAAAILYWKLVQQRGPRSKVKPEMVRELALAYEAAADFASAAMSYEAYLSVYYEAHAFTGDGQVPKDAPAILTRAACIWRQLGDEQGARRTTSQLQRMSKTPIDPDTLCDHVRPMTMPPKTP